MYRKIDLFVDGKYLCSSIRYTSCKQFIANVKGNNNSITFANRISNNFTMDLTNRKLTAFFAK
jgi:hypothetical protein